MENYGLKCKNGGIRFISQHVRSICGTFQIMGRGSWESSAPEKEIVKMFVSGLKPEVFREEIYSRAFETLVGVMAETRHELANYRDIIEIS